MTLVKIHGALGEEYGNTFVLNIGNPKHVLQAIDCNRSGFISKLVELQKQGLGYEIIINQNRLTDPSHMESFQNPKRIDLVPLIAGSSGFEFAILFEKLFFAVLFATITYALTPKPEIDALEVEARANTQSLIFSNRVNVASQGAPVPIGYGRLKVGTQVIQATIKSYPQYSDPNYILTDNRSEGEVAVNTNVRQERPLFLGEEGDGQGAAYQG
tara:strand:+ start:655 stop:1296 length:642 start_codon:yes stop_codon:yes gene_type:complete